MKRYVAGMVAMLPIAVFARQAPRVEGPLTIDQAVAVAQKHNPQIAGALADAFASSGDVRAARARKGPQVTLNGFASSGNESQIATSPSAVSMLVPNGGFADANLSLMLPLYTGGALEGAIAAASWAQRAATANVAEVRSSVSLDVATAYLSSLRDQAIAADVAQQLVSQREITRVARALYEAGKEIGPSVGRAEAEEAGLRRRVESANNDVAKSLVALNGAMGVDFDSQPRLAEGLDSPDRPLSLDEYLREAENHRGMLLAARAKVEAAQGGVRSSEGAFRPQLYGYAMGDAASDSSMGGSVVGLTLSFPVFDGGLRRAELARSRGEHDRASADLRAARIAVEQDVRQAYLDVQTAGKNLALAQSAVEPMDASYRAVSLRYANGKATLLEQLQALEALTRARTDLAQAQFDRRLAVVRLERAAGLLPHATPASEEKNS